MNPNTPATKFGLNSLYWFLRYGVHKVFMTHRLTYSRTDTLEYSVTVLFKASPSVLSQDNSFLCILQTNTVKHLSVYQLK